MINEESEGRCLSRRIKVVTEPARSRRYDPAEATKRRIGDCEIGAG